MEVNKSDMTKQNINVLTRGCGQSQFEYCILGLLRRIQREKSLLFKSDRIDFDVALTPGIVSLTLWPYFFIFEISELAVAAAIELRKAWCINEDSLTTPKLSKVCYAGARLCRYHGQFIWDSKPPSFEKEFKCPENTISPKVSRPCWSMAARRLYSED